MGEVVLDDSWVLLAQDEPIIRRAAEDLRDFMAIGMETPVAIGGVARRVLSLEQDSSLPGPEAHRIIVEPDSIRVLGYDGAGVLQGVFFLESLMVRRGGPFLASRTLDRRPLFARRIHRGPFSPHYADELTCKKEFPWLRAVKGLDWEYPVCLEEDAGPAGYYPDNLLLLLARQGLNGLWLHGVLQDLARVSVFPEFGVDAGPRLELLNDLCSRAATFGLRVYLFFHEPVGQPAGGEFFSNHPHCRGSYVDAEGVYCLCTSTPEVKVFLEHGFHYLFDHAPGLAGALVISASEQPHHCYSRSPSAPTIEERRKLVEQGLLCARCADREPREVVAEVLNLMHRGMKAANPDAELIAWNWSWNAYEPDPQPRLLAALPEGLVLMGDFERGVATRALDFEYVNDEYSLKVIGPSPRFLGVAAHQKERGQPVYAKVQLGTTHEDGSVPYLPVMRKIAAKYLALHETGVTGMMTCWNFGNMPGRALEVANTFAWDPLPDTIESGLLTLAVRDFGQAAAPKVVEAWECFSEAIEAYPATPSVMYRFPLTRGPAYPFLWERTGLDFPESYLVDRKEGDNLASWTQPFGEEKVAECFQAVADRWKLGVQLLEQALAATSGFHRDNLLKELGLAKTCLCQFQCTVNIIAFLLARDRYRNTEDAEEKAQLLAKLAEVVEDERTVCRDVLPWLQADPRLGFHGEAYEYLFNPALVKRKLERLEAVAAAIATEKATLAMPQSQ